MRCRQFFSDMICRARLACAGVLFAFQNADGIDGWSVFGLQPPYRLLERLGALVVISVRDYKNYLLFELGILFR